MSEKSPIKPNHQNLKRLIAAGTALVAVAGLPSSSSNETASSTPRHETQQEADNYDSNKEKITEALAELGPEDLHKVAITNVEVGEHIVSPFPQDRHAEVPTIRVTYEQQKGEQYDEFWEPLPVGENEQVEVLWAAHGLGAESATDGEVAIPGLVLPEEDPDSLSYLPYINTYAGEEPQMFNAIIPLSPSFPERELQVYQRVGIGADGEMEEIDASQSGLHASDNPILDISPFDEQNERRHPLHEDPIVINITDGEAHIVQNPFAEE